MEQRPCEAALIVLGYLNFNIMDPEGNIINKEIVEDLLDMLMEYMCAHFLLIHTTWERDGRTWRMI